MKQILLGGVGLALAACAQTPGPVDGGRAASLDAHAMMLEISMSVLDCLPEDWSPEQVEALQAADFEIADPDRRRAFAMYIRECLGNHVPARREMAYEAFTHMLRAKQLDDATKRDLMGELEGMLEAPDPLGVRRSYAALVLSEIARADRIEAFLTEQERIDLLVKAQHWFINIQDYRGFDEEDGWRHAVAHGSDLLMQLALNPRIDNEGLRVIISAVGIQAVQSTTAYADGEAERLARPILFAAARGALSEQEWTDWLKAIATPKDAEKVFATRAGLNWRNNTMAFLQALYVNVVIGSDPKDDVLRPGLEAALKAMP